MTVKKVLALVLALMLLVSSMAFSAMAASTSGMSSGGTLGTCRCTGLLTLKNAEKDTATAKTTSGAKGKLSALAKIFWSNGTTTVNRSRDKTSNTTSTSVSVTATADNEYGIYGLSSHAYTSEDYGTWFGTTNQDF